MTSNVNNQGIVHAAFRDGGQPLCKQRRAHMSMSIERFRADAFKCKRCAAKLAEMDERDQKKRVVGTIDLTPTWKGVLPVYLAALCDGTDNAKQAARGELMRMAELADAQVAARA